MKQPPQYDWTLTGFVVALIMVVMFSGMFVVFAAALQTSMGLSGNITLDKYNRTAEIMSYTEKVRNSTDVHQETGVLDVIGGYFSSGYTALKLGAKSFDIFDSMMNDAADDIEGFDFFRGMLTAIVLIGLFMGVLVAAIIKWKT